MQYELTMCRNSIGDKAGDDLVGWGKVAAMLLVVATNGPAAICRPNTPCVSSSV